MSNNEMKNDKFNVFFASAHVGIILEYSAMNKSKSMKILTGHVSMYIITLDMLIVIFLMPIFSVILLAA